MAEKENNSGAILKSYEEARPIYEAFTNKIESLIRELLKDASIDTHSVNSRLKNSTSLSDKLQRGVEKYDKLEDVTDLSGVRITCWLLEQIPQIEHVIKENFDINEVHSINKREKMDADRFGYVSIHYIISLSDARKNLSEFRRYAGLRCEVQIRTILQHAWAEIEHDLGYKSKIEIPKNIKRRFYRLAGLLELADDEFQGLSGDIDEYRNTVNERIERRDKDVLIDKISLVSYIDNSELLRNLDDQIVIFFKPAKQLSAPSISLENDLKILSFFDIGTIGQLDEILEKNSEQIVALAKNWIGEDEWEGLVPKGVSIFYLGYYLAGRTKDQTKMKAYLDMFDFDTDVSAKLSVLTKDL